VLNNKNGGLGHRQTLRNPDILLVIGLLICLSGYKIPLRKPAFTVQ